MGIGQMAPASHLGLRLEKLSRVGVAAAGRGGGRRGKRREESHKDKGTGPSMLLFRQGDGHSGAPASMIGSRGRGGLSKATRGSLQLGSVL